MEPIKCVLYEGRWEDEIEPLRDPVTKLLPAGTMFYMHFAGGQCSNHNLPCCTHLMVVTPDGHWWDIDSRAGNCTKPEDKYHHCWVRHGKPPDITVDKNGITCDAGAGSIQTPKWHGFLRGGYLVQ